MNHNSHTKIRKKLFYLNKAIVPKTMFKNNFKTITAHRAQDEKSDLTSVVGNQTIN